MLRGVTIVGHLSFILLFFLKSEDATSVGFVLTSLDFKPRYKMSCMATLYCELLMTGLETHECTNKFMELPLMRYRVENEVKSSIKAEVMSDELRVLEEYQFNCSSTNITSLVLGIDVERNSDARDLFPSVRIFRKNSNNPNRYYAVTGSERTIYYSTSNVSTDTGGYQYPLNPPMPVMSGDLLAVSQPEKRKSRVTVCYIDEINFLSTCIEKISNDQYQIDLSSSPITDELILVYPITGKTHTHCIIELFYYH